MRRGRDSWGAMALVVLVVPSPARADEPGRLGRLFRIGGNSSPDPATRAPVPPQPPGLVAPSAAGLGAGRVIGVDLSESVEAAGHFSRDLSNVAIVQADIYRLPFRDPFDFAFSIGVIHHLPDPAAGIASVAKHVKMGGSLFAWVYGYENNEWIVNVVNPIRERFTSRLPRRALYALSWAITAVVQPFLRLYRPEKRTDVGRFLPYYPYMHWLSQYDFRHNLVVIFDHLVAPTAFYVKRDELRSWFERAGFPRMEISARNANSWRGHGRRDESA